MANFITSKGQRFTSNLSFNEAYQLLQRFDRNHGSYSFVASLLRQSNRLTQTQVPYFYLMAEQQREIEQIRQEEQDAIAVREREAQAQAETDTVVEQTPVSSDTQSFIQEKLFMLQYDIPNTNDGPVFPNPSSILRTRAIRTNLSVWVVPESRIPHVLINDMRSAGCTVHTLAFDSSDVENIMKLCEESLAREIKEAEQRLNQSIQTAQGYTSEKKVESYIENAGKKCATLLEDLRNAAELFGLANGQRLAERVFGTTRLLTETNSKKSKEYAKAARIAAQSTSYDAAAVGASALNHGPVNPAALADVIRETGDDETADRIEEAFRK